MDEDGRLTDNASLGLVYELELSNPGEFPAEAVSFELANVLGGDGISFVPNLGGIARIETGQAGSAWKIERMPPASRTKIRIIRPPEAGIDLPPHLQAIEAMNLASGTAWQHPEARSPPPEAVKRAWQTRGIQAAREQPRPRIAAAPINDSEPLAKRLVNERWANVAAEDLSYLTIHPDQGPKTELRTLVRTRNAPEGDYSLFEPILVSDLAFCGLRASTLRSAYEITARERGRDSAPRPTPTEWCETLVLRRRFFMLVSERAKTTNRPVTYEGFQVSFTVPLSALPLVDYCIALTEAALEEECKPPSMPHVAH